VIDVVLHPGRDRSLRRRHPWVLSGAVARVPADAAPGAFARVLAAEGEVLGFGHYSPHSALRVRMLAFGKDVAEAGLLEARIAEAVARRRGDPLLDDTDAVRLVNAEGDGLPGLVADRYGDALVVKLTSAGMLVRREAVAAALREASGCAVGFERADTPAARKEGLPARQGALWGEPPAGPIWICERGRRYRVDLAEGQKTGFYLDQRDARDLVERLAGGRRVLDLFCYTGGFAVAAARGGAQRLTLVDSSAAALALAQENLAANAADAANGADTSVNARCAQADAFEFLRADDAGYDLLVLDPPPMARAERDVARAGRAYKDLLRSALRRAAPRARLLVFACSHHIGAEKLRQIVFGAALEAGRPLRVLATLGAAPDHVVALDHPEGAYLSGLLLEA
jgi:23S rRNA (cytosine1962-C5)-methyltransferase